jgi:hypothetical protein
MFASHFRRIKVRTPPSTELAAGDLQAFESPALIRADPDSRPSGNR